MNRKRALILSALVVSVLFVVVAASAGLYVFTRDDTSDVVTRTLGGGDSGDPNTISIYAPSQLSKVLERVTTTFQQENPGTTFQFTLGPSAELAERIQNDQKPSIYIDQAAGISFVSAKVRPKAAPIPFGHDIVQLAVKRGNPKQVGGLDVFGSSPSISTGICAPEIACGKVDARVLQRAGVNAAPQVVTTNVGELLDGVARGSIDAVLLLRTDLRSVLTSISAVRIPRESAHRLEYQMVQFQSGGPPDQFIQWVQGSPSARHVLRHSGMLSYYDV